MSTTVNENAVEAVSNQQEQQFSSRVAPSEPMMQKGVSRRPISHTNAVIIPEALP